jgi:hypothetical protein
MDAIFRLVAIEDIKNVKARYFRGVDQKDESLLREVFADDVEVDYRGAATDPVTGFNASAEATDTVHHGGDFCAKLVATALPGVVSVHHASVPEIDIIDEENARAIWPMVDRLRFGEDSPISEMIGYGHYHETYVRTGAKWRIKSMRLTRLRLDVIRP